MRTQPKNTRQTMFTLWWAGGFIFCFLFFACDAWAQTRNQKLTKKQKSDSIYVAEKLKREKMIKVCRLRLEAHDPTAGGCYYDIGFAQNRLGKYYDAIQTFDEGIPLILEFYQTLHENHYLSYSSIERIKSNYVKGIYLSYAERGYAYFKTQQYTKAIADWEEMKRFAPADYKPEHNYIDEARKKEAENSGLALLRAQLEAEKKKNEGKQTAVLPKKDVTPPTLVLPNLPTSSPSKAYLLAGKAEDSNGIKSIRINGKEIPFFPDGRFEQEVELKEGQNTFTVQASDLAGNASEKRVSLAYRFAGKFPLPKRLALLVGNSAYKYTYKLEKPRADAEEMKKALEALNFKVIVLYDGSKEAMRTAIDDFTQELKTGGYDVGLFFYAEHGAQIDLKMKSHNFLIPTDAKLQDDQKAEFECVYAQEILDGMERSGVKVSLLFLDACRDNPYQKVYGKKRVLGSLESGKGSFVSYATDSGRQAWEDGDGKNSHFTAALLKYINQPNRSIGQIMQTVTKEVSEKTKGNQEPGSYNKLTDDFYFLIEE